ncbi:asparagine synthase (glutamine-hydrolyzing) [Myxococcota bacterium]|nr:asparagine synthase (glutamine-hydrolyzing) [Myxococcota bacterium]
MCGISGFQGSFEPALLDRMNDAIAHRGPDDQGTLHLSSDGIGLAHRRLSIIDLSDRGHQPMWDVSESVVVSYNGEIYNYKDLRRELISDGFRFHSDCDTEVLLNLYLRDGDKMLERLNGIFAFALWDKRSKTLLIARDGMGVKPLYFATTPKGVVFASELKALLQEPSVDRSLEHNAIQHHLTYLWCPSPLTMLTAVRKLEPGRAIKVRDGRIVDQFSFYELPFSEDLVDWPIQDAVVQVRKYLVRAVERQLVSDVPVGAFLSGGLDSSSVVAIAQRRMGEESLQCFTIGFKGDDRSADATAEDLPYALRVANHLGVDLHTVFVGSEMLDDLPKMLFHLDEPQADPAPINALWISQLAKERNIKVLLSGAGGDDIFTGYRRHYALGREPYWTWLPQPIKQAIGSYSARLQPTTELRRRLSKAFRSADMPRDERIISYFQWIQPRLLEEVLSEPLLHSLSNPQLENPIRDALHGLSDDVPALNRMLYLESRFFLADHNLNYVDKVSMASGVEVRVPMIDPELTRLAARLPIQFKQRGSIGKWILRKAMEPYLPKQVIYRPKTGFGAPLRRWLHHDLRELLEELLSDRSLRDRGLFNPAGVRNLIELDRKRQIDASYSIFSILCIELWCRMFLDQRVPTTVEIGNFR